MNVALRLRCVALLLAVLIAGCGGSDAGPGDGAATRGDTKVPPVLGKPADDEEAGQALGFPAFATKNTTRVGGADPIADAAGVALAVYPSATRETRPGAVVLVDVEDWQTAISAAQLMGRPLAAPILFSEDGELPEATRDALEQLQPRGAAEAGGAQVIRVGDATRVQTELKTTDVVGRDAAGLARAIDRLAASAAKRPSPAVVVAPSDDPAFAMPAAGYAAKAGVPVLWASRDRLPAATRQAIEAREQPSIYVLGPESAISRKVARELAELGAVERIAGPDPAANSVAFARYADGRFGWNVVDPGHGLVFLNAERTADAAAAAPLSATGSYGPLLLVRDAERLPPPVESYLLDIQPGYDRDPVRGVYNRGWIMGDEDAVSVPVQARIDALLEIQPVDLTD